jgi:hypothetical protein
VNATKPPGEWQSFDITFRAPRFDADGKKVSNAKFVKVVHNGKVIHENVDLTGPTRAAHWDDEKPAGPIMLQGDHGPVAYRNLRVKTSGPIKPDFSQVQSIIQNEITSGKLPSVLQLDHGNAMRISDGKPLCSGVTTFRYEDCIFR